MNQRDYRLELFPAHKAWSDIRGQTTCKICSQGMFSTQQGASM
jgi:hypothetical protein